MTVLMSDDGGPSRPDETVRAIAEDAVRSEQQLSDASDEELLSIVFDGGASSEYQEGLAYLAMAEFCLRDRGYEIETTDDGVVVYDPSGDVVDPDSV